MKRKPGFTAKQIAGQYIAFPLGTASKEFHGTIKLNGSGLFIWEQLENDTTEEKIVDAMLEQYEIDRETAEADVARFVGVLRNAGLLVE